VERFTLFFRNISADYRRIYDLTEDKSRLVRIIYPFLTPGFHAMFWFRLIQANRRWRIPVLFYIFAVILKIINTFIQWLWGICIASNSDIGPGLYIAHHGQIFVGVKKMGANCTLGHSITVGRTESETGYPSIGDNVYIAPGAVVVGRIEIGDNVKIGPNAVVRRNLPANSVVVAVPPRVIVRTSKEEWQTRKPSEAHVPSKKPDEYKQRQRSRRPVPSQSNNRTQSNARHSKQKRNGENGQDQKVKSKQRGTRFRRDRYRKKPVTQEEKPQQNHQEKPVAQESDKPEGKKEAESLTLFNEPVMKKDANWRTGRDRDKWAEDMEGESLDG
jgi:serine O-acetyltransferase